MKTSLACLGILIAALWIGGRQADRIGDLKDRIEHAPALNTMPSTRRMECEDSPGYRTRNPRPTNTATASGVFEEISSLVPPLGGNAMGPDAAQQHPEALRAILQLDLKGIGELMSLVYQSKDLARTWPMQHITANLCLIGMTERSPQAAFTHMTEDERWNRLFTPDHIGDEGMVSYVLARMAVDDPQSAVDAMHKLDSSPKALNDQSTRQILWLIAHRDPALTLDTIGELPDADRERNYQIISYGLESDDERTAMFLAARDRLDSRPAEMKLVLKSVCDRFGDAKNSMAESRKWLESLGMTDAEKNLVLDPLCRVLAEGYSTSVLDNARWFAKFMPPSDERDWLILRHIEPALGQEPASMDSFCRELGIDLEKMRKLEMGGK